MLKVVNFVREAIQELIHKMSWPTQKELERFSNLFFIGLFVCVLIVSISNASLEKVLRWLYAKF